MYMFNNINIPVRYTLSKYGKSPCQRKRVQVKISHPCPFPQPIKDIDHSC